MKGHIFFPLGRSRYITVIRLIVIVSNCQLRMYTTTRPLTDTGRDMVVERFWIQESVEESILDS